MIYYLQNRLENRIDIHEDEIIAITVEKKQGPPYRCLCADHPSSEYTLVGRCKGTNAGTG